MENLKIVNIVATFNIGQIFSNNRFRWIAEYGLNTELNPKRPHIIIIRLRRIHKNQSHYTISAILSKNGKIILSGAKNNQEVYRMAHRVTRYIIYAVNMGAKLDNHTHDYGQYKVKNLKIQNITGHMTFPFNINIKSLQNDIEDKKFEMIFCSSQYKPS